MIELGLHGPETDTLGRINALIERRRRILQEASVASEPAAAAVRQIDGALAELWNQRRRELRVIEREEGRPAGPVPSRVPRPAMTQPDLEVEGSVVDAR
ncbi:MAG TPA: hypothetical protein VFN57_00595 [Thermomicrobiaceae bacterium]|nr:hypothetical protein [Thermomicrobiaceae bacterium]